ncbi:MAG: hypothetical protein ABI880_11520 [Acidobacteriota bacterium]
MQPTSGGDDARTPASQMSRALIAFAKTGDPNHDGIPMWAPFTESTRAIMIVDARCEMNTDPDRAAPLALASP